MHCQKTKLIKNCLIILLNLVKYSVIMSYNLRNVEDIYIYRSFIYLGAKILNALHKEKFAANLNKLKTKCGSL